MPEKFVHLHLHTDYSMLDGACKIAKLANRLKELDMGMCACADHGNLSAAIEFYETMNANDIKPIIGSEFYIAPKGIQDKTDKTRFHLVLLAETDEGYKNLCRLMAISYSDEAFYYKPRVDKEALRKHSEGIIAMSACIQGEVAWHIIRNDMVGAKKALEEYIDIYGRDNFFLEVMNHGLQEEEIANKGLLTLSQEYEIGLVATNDAHYVNKEDYDAHDALLCIGTQKTIADPNRMKFTTNEFYVKSYEEMASWAKDFPGAIENTVKIGERCNVEFKLYTENHYPVYRLPDGSDKEDDMHCPIRKQYLRDICTGNLMMRYQFEENPNPTDFQKEVIERMDFELGIIDRMGFVSYFLVVWDFINWAKEHGIPVGPGRGSGAGSIVAYLTGITDIDPLEFSLLFERFLNPDRVSPPDFDIDICERRRVEVIEYVRGKYGAERVCQIGTFGTLKAKAVLKDVARVMGKSFAESNSVTNLIPTDPKMTLEKALDIGELKELKQNEDWVDQLFDYSSVLEGLNRNQSIHAAGVIIGDQPLDSVVPLARGASKEVITQFPAVPCEALGLLKMDFLGLKTLTVIQDALDILKESQGIDLVAIEFPQDDPKTYELLNKGNTVGVFQLESGGMQDLCRKFKVGNLKDISAILALYRPGPMEFIPTYIARKEGREPVEYDTPEMEALLKETFGIMIYQEQIMQVVQVVAGFTLAQADIMRRAIGKKKAKVLKEQGEKFVEGCLKNNVSETVANNIWDKVLTFAGYGFNKSHSAAYAFLAFQTAFLKGNYPSEFMAAVLSNELGNAEKIRFFINECKEMQLEVCPPSINRSRINFSVDGEAIIFGLGAIKGVGESAAKAIINTRKKEGDFKSMLDFCERVGKHVNSKKIESLVKAGAFDCLGLRRSQMIAMIEDSVKAAQNKIKDRESGQGSLFDMLDDSEQEEFTSIPIPDIPEFEEKQMLQEEKELLGFYVTGHPLARFEKVIKTHSSNNLIEVMEMDDNTGVKFGCMIKSAMKRLSKKNGKPYAILQVEDLDGAMDCMVYSRLFDTELGENERPPIDDGEEGGEIQFVKDLLEEDRPVFIEALVSQNDEMDSKKLIAERLIPLENANSVYSDELHIHIYEGSNDADTLEKLKCLCMNHPGNTKLILCITCSNGEIGFVEAAEPFSVTVSNLMLDQLQDLLGEGKYKIKSNPAVPPPRKKFIPKSSD